MHRTLNCGIGLVIVVDASEQDKAIEILTNAGETVSVIGQIEASDQAEPTVKLVQG